MLIASCATSGNLTRAARLLAHRARDSAPVSDIVDVEPGTTGTDLA